MKLTITPSRILNDERGVFGLLMSDVAAGVGVFVVLSLLLDGTAISILALPVSAMSLIPLSPIRLSTRRHIIRDALAYWLTSKNIFNVRKYVCSRA